VESVLGKAVTSNLHFLYKNINKKITQEHLVRACSLTQDKIIYTLEIMKKLKIEYKLENRQNDVIDDLNDSRFHINFIVCSY
jgi:hypothetical protein